MTPRWSACRTPTTARRSPPSSRSPPTDFDGAEADILASLGGRLARFKIPTAIRLVEHDLPRTATGKVLKRELRDRFTRQEL